MDYTIFYKTAFENSDDWDSLPEYDLFISTYNCSERVNYNFDKIRAKNKHWFITPHYKVGENRPTNGEMYSFPFFSEDDFIFEYFKQTSIPLNWSICIDITGFIRPYILFLFRYLAVLGFKKIDVIYTEPSKYIKSEETEFSGFVEIVKTVPGCSAIDLLPSSENDVLIIAVGYDDKLISAVADSKKHCSLKYKIFGFPSLQADMYQESVLQVHNARESLGNDALTVYAPAFDPFVTAQLLQDTINGYLGRDQANFYLSGYTTAN